MKITLHYSTRVPERELNVVRSLLAYAYPDTAVREQYLPHTELPRLVGGRPALVLTIGEKVFYSAEAYLHWQVTLLPVPSLLEPAKG